MRTVEDILLKKGAGVVTTHPTSSVREAVHQMAEANVGCLLIEDDSRIVGIMTERDLLRRVVDADRDPRTTPVREVMSSPAQTCSPADEVRQCADTLSHHSFRHLAVMDNEEAVGVVSLRDLAGELRKGS